MIPNKKPAPPYGEDMESDFIGKDCCGGKIGHRFFCSENTDYRSIEEIEKDVDKLQPFGDSPIDMILPCPKCRTLHVDAPELECKCGHYENQHIQGKSIDKCPDWGCECTEYRQRWPNPPHKSHLCHNCGLIWRPADIPTNGVAEIKTRGKEDTWRSKS